MCNACIEVGIAYSRNQIHLVSLRHKVVSYIENIRNWIIAALIIEHCRPSRFVTKSLTDIVIREDDNVRDCRLLCTNVCPSNYQEGLFLFVGTTSDDKHVHSGSHVQSWSAVSPNINIPCKDHRCD